jgi:hypothetical protein
LIGRDKAYVCHCTRAFRFLGLCFFAFLVD